MTAMTTSSSISVNAVRNLEHFAELFFILCIEFDTNLAEAAKKSCHKNT
jgi:hypothetical protein